LRYLEENQWKAIPKPVGFTETYLPLKDESYLVQDHFGNEKVLVLTSERNTLGNLATHELAEAIGVKHLPAHPVLILRGRNNIPLLADFANPEKRAFLFAPDASKESKLTIHIPDDSWAQALIFPLHRFTPTVPEPKTAEALSDLMKQVIFHAALAAAKTTTSYIDGEPYFFWADDIFKNLGQKLDWELFKEEMKPIPYQALKSLSQTEADFLTGDLAAFLDRLEWISDHGINTIFAPLAAHYADVHKVKLDLTNRLRDRIKTLRPLTEKYLQNRIGGRFSQAALPKSLLPIEMLYVPPHLGGQRYPTKIPSLGNEFTRRTLARSLLESYFFSTPLIRVGMLKQWAKELNSSDPLGQLMKEAHQWDSTVRLINGKTLRSNTRERRVRTPQHFLNKNLEKQILVYSPNDAEGEEIDYILHEIGNRLPLIPMAFDIQRGRGLGPEDLKAIVRVAQDHQTNKITLIESNGFSEAQKTYLHSHGLVVDYIDHHYSDNLSSWHPYSALEQFAGRINYQLCLEQQLTALQDRSGANAFHFIQWDKKTVADYLSRRFNVSEIHREYAGVFDAAGIDVVPVIHRNEALGRLMMALSWEVYPRVPNAIIVRNTNIIFSGKPEVAMSLYDTYRTRDDVFIMWGGSFNSSIYIKITPRPGLSLQDLTHEISITVGNSKELITPCLLQIRDAA